jgi:hypothetical protein
MISENKKAILIELLKASEDELCSLLNNIEEDKNVPDDSWDSIDDQSKRLFELFTLMYNEIYYS